MTDPVTPDALRADADYIRRHFYMPAEAARIRAAADRIEALEDNAVYRAMIDTIEAKDRIIEALTAQRDATREDWQRMTAERDEAVALLRDASDWAERGDGNTDAHVVEYLQHRHDVRAFLVRLEAE